MLTNVPDHELTLSPDKKSSKRTGGFGCSNSYPMLAANAYRGRETAHDSA